MSIDELMQDIRDGRLVIFAERDQVVARNGTPEQRRAIGRHYASLLLLLTRSDTMVCMDVEEHWPRYEKLSSSKGIYSCNACALQRSQWRHQWRDAQAQKTPSLAR